MYPYNILPTLPDAQLVELLRYALAWKARLGLASEADVRLLREIVYYVDPIPRRMEVMQVA